MSSETIVAKRYARALFEVAQQNDQVTKVEEDLQGVNEVVRQNADLKKVLHHPNIATSAKLEILKQAFQGKVSEAVFNVLQLLVERRRESLLVSLYDTYVTIANEALGQANAIVYTAFPLSDADGKAIADQFGKLTGKKIRIESVVDPKVLGGIQVRIGDRLYDGSLAGKLERMQKTLKQSQAL